MSSHKRSSSAASIAPKRAAAPDQVPLSDGTPLELVVTTGEILHDSAYRCVDTARSLSTAFDAASFEDAKDRAAIAADLLHAKSVALTLFEAAELQAESPRDYIETLSGTLQQLQAARNELGPHGSLMANLVASTLRDCVAAQTYRLVLTPLAENGVVPIALSRNIQSAIVLGVGNGCQWYALQSDGRADAEVVLLNGNYALQQSLRMHLYLRGQYRPYAVSPRTGELWIARSRHGFQVADPTGQVRDVACELDGDLIGLSFTAAGDLVVHYWRCGAVHRYALTVDSDLKAQEIYAGVGWNDSRMRSIDDQGNVWAWSESTDYSSRKHWIDADLFVRKADGSFGEKHTFAIALYDVLDSHARHEKAWTCASGLVVAIRYNDTTIRVVHLALNGKSQMFEIRDSRGLGGPVFDQAKSEIVCCVRDSVGSSSFGVMSARLQLHA
jgi:hypothetical protein